MEHSKLLTAQEAAAQLQISDDQIYLMIRKGDLPVVRLGRLVRIRQEHLDQFVENHVVGNK